MDALALFNEGLEVDAEDRSVLTSIGDLLYDSLIISKYFASFILKRFLHLSNSLDLSMNA